MLARELAQTPVLKHGLIIFGHSLGGAVAAALTMLLRYKKPPPGEHSFATHALKNARCCSFSPPPFLSKYLALLSTKLPVTSIVYGLDVVPRLSPATVDRLLRELSAYDFSPHVTSAVSKLVKSVALPVLGSKGSDALAERARDMSVDEKTLAAVSGTVASVAGTALLERTANRLSNGLLKANGLAKTEERRKLLGKNGNGVDKRSKSSSKCLYHKIICSCSCSRPNHTNSNTHSTTCTSTL